MAKKHKNIRNSNKNSSGPKTAVVPTPTEAAFPNDLPPEQALLKLDDLIEMAKAYLSEENWDDLVRLGNTLVSDIVEADRKAAAVWLLRVQVIGYTHCQELHRYQIKGEPLEKLNEALIALAEKLPQFHRIPEFDVYLNMVGGYPSPPLESAVQAFKKLQVGFFDEPQPHWLPVVRSLGMRLMSPEQFFNDIELSNTQRVFLESLGDIGLALSQMYGRAEGCEGWSEKDKLIVKVLQIDLNAQLADPWDYKQISNAILRLPQPDPAELPKRNDGSALQHLTPAGWVFLWDIGHSSAKEWPDLLVKHTGPFGCDACKGLKLIVQSLNAESARVDEFLSQGVQALMKHLHEGGEILGSCLTVALSEGSYQLPISPRKLTFPDISELLLGLVEYMPDSYSRTAELTTFYRIFSAAEREVQLDDEGGNGLPGLEWLCMQSLSFHLAAAACSRENLADRMVLLLQGLCRCAQEGHPAKGSYYYWGNLKEGELQPEQVGIILDQLAQLVPLRARLDEHSESIWSDVVADIFTALSRKGMPLDRTLVLAREFSEDLLGADQEFRLAYLEQLAGSADMALYYYLQYLEGEGQARTTALTNIKLLWSGNDDLEQVQNLVEQLEAAVAANPHQEELRQLLADAQARLKLLAKEQQFEKTAVNRWPDISIPARKLLGVLHVIDNYSSFEELGGYASMDAIWAKRHYKKLVETGMLLVANSKFRVNPFIEPLLEREAQHAVVGRIIRAQGTSAVKQVFNSQREFFIYQIMVQLCPNHLVFPNSSLQSIMSYDRMRELVSDDDFGYYLRASVDLVLISSTTYLPWLAIEVDSIWHDTERQQKNDGKKDRIFAAAGVPFMRLQPVGNPSEATIRGQVSQHLDELVRTLRTDFPGYEQARRLLENLSGVNTDVEKII